MLQKLKYKRKTLETDGTNIWKNECRKYLCLGRNAIAVIFGTLLAYTLDANDIQPFTLTGEPNHMHLSSIFIIFFKLFHRWSCVWVPRFRFSTVRNYHWQSNASQFWNDHPPGFIRHSDSIDIDFGKYCCRKVIL